ncbi:MAG: aminotransferase class IV [Deltaproteobacteria bacterium]|jgi:branched-chain amino acid aminotransferase|nr:aminotransferase class IV [Deltaproteobacteria bacterium]
MTDKPKVWLNNKIIPWDDAQVPILSHGFARGSAVFEVFGTHAVPDGIAAFRMDAHLKRLEQTVSLLGMELGFSIQEIVKAVSKLAVINLSERGLVKIVAYWGEEAIINLVLKSKLDVAIFTIPTSEELGLDKVKPLSACISKWKKLHPETIPVQAKACANYLNGYLVRKDANDRGFDLGLNLGTDGFLAEGSIESVFIVKDGILKTPPLGRILASVTRDSIINAAKHDDIEVCETALVKEDLYTADEIFTCHTGIKVTPIFRFEELELKAPGPVTTQVSEMMNNIINSRDSRFKEWFQMLYRH